jgi:hypothetical protein
VAIDITGQRGHGLSTKEFRLVQRQSADALQTMRWMRLALDALLRNTFLLVSCIGRSMFDLSHVYEGLFLYLHVVCTTCVIDHMSPHMSDSLSSFKSFGRVVLILRYVQPSERVVVFTGPIQNANNSQVEPNGVFRYVVASYISIHTCQYSSTFGQIDNPVSNAMLFRCSSLL